MRFHSFSEFGSGLGGERIAVKAEELGRQLPLVSLPQTAHTGNDFYTPPALFLALGLTFDLDVCAPPGGVPWIPAAQHYTLEDDGLSKAWEGRVWMNPPFSKPAPWVERFIAHRNGIALLPQAKSRWSGVLWDSDVALVSIPDHFGFIRPGVEAGNIASPVVLAAFTEECVAAIQRLGKPRVLRLPDDATALNKGVTSAK